MSVQNIRKPFEKTDKNVCFLQREQLSQYKTGLISVSHKTMCLLARNIWNIFLHWILYHRLKSITCRVVTVLPRMHWLMFSVVYVTKGRFGTGTKCVNIHYSHIMYPLFTPLLEWNVCVLLGSKNCNSEICYQHLNQNTFNLNKHSKQCQKYSLKNNETKRFDAYKYNKY